MIRKRVAVESPYAGDVAANIDFARNICRTITNMGASPFAMHLFYTQFLDDEVPAERQLGIECGLAWLRAANEVWFCLRETGGLSEGMRQAEEYLRSIEGPERRYMRFFQDGRLIAEYSSASFSEEVTERIVDMEPTDQE